MCAAMTTMRAALLEAPGSLSVVDDVEIADPRSGEVLVRVSHCGVCHSDLSVYDGSFPSAVPTVLGHEASGVVEAVGTGVHSVAVGDPVILTPVPNCGRCYFCVRDQPTLCQVHSIALFTGLLPDGTTPLSWHGSPVFRGLATAAWGELTIMPEVAVVKVDPDVPLDVACVIGCAVQTGVGAVLNTAAVEPGATVLVLGAGGIGVAVTQGARIAGAAMIVVSDPSAERRETALRFGATHVLDPEAGDVPTAVYELTGGIGMDYCFEAAGQAALIETGIAASRNGGTTVCVGAPPIDQGIAIPGVVGFSATEKRLIGCLLGSSNSHREIPRLLSLWKAGRLDLEAMITARRPIDEVVDALTDMQARAGLRTVLDVA
jgi:S-(hydroxymethyl)glutathione dehydrogenase / alcohol dehydrogenase